MAAWQYTLTGIVRDAIAAYYVRYPDATPGEIEAWLRDRGFDVGVGDVEDYMAALDSRPDWRTGWINRNIHRQAGALDPDQFLLTRTYGEGGAPQVAEQESADELDEGDEEEYEDEELEGEEPAEEGGEYEGQEPGEPEPGDEHEDEELDETEFAAGEELSSEELSPSLAPALAGADWLPGLALAVLGLAATAGIIALLVAVMR